jgi:hypothetical protein
LTAGRLASRAAVPEGVAELAALERRFLTSLTTPPAVVFEAVGRVAVGVAVEPPAADGRVAVVARGEAVVDDAAGFLAAAVAAAAVVEAGFFSTVLDGDVMVPEPAIADCRRAAEARAFFFVSSSEAETDG